MIINLTPHPCTLVLGNQNIVLPAPKVVARVEQKSQYIGSLPLGNQLGAQYHVPIYSNEYGEVQGLPPQKSDTYYVVSRMVAEAAWDRRDLLVPNDTVRDPNGRIIGCRSFYQLTLSEEESATAVEAAQRS